jgi:hypothetical protein
LPKTLETLQELVLAEDSSKKPNDQTPVQSSNKTIEESAPVAAAEPAPNVTGPKKSVLKSFDSREFNRMRIKLLVICRFVRGFESAENYLLRRGWQITVMSNTKDAFKKIAEIKPDFVMISINLPEQKVSQMPELVMQAFRTPTIAYAENMDARSTLNLKEANAKYKLEGLASGPNTHRRIKNILQEIFADPKAIGYGIFDREFNQSEVAIDDNSKRKRKKGYTFSLDDAGANGEEEGSGDAAEGSEESGYRREKRKMQYNFTVDESAKSDEPGYQFVSEDEKSSREKQSAREVDEALSPRSKTDPFNQEDESIYQKRARDRQTAQEASEASRQEPAKLSQAIGSEDSGQEVESQTLEKNNYQEASQEEIDKFRAQLAGLGVDATSEMNTTASAANATESGDLKILQSKGQAAGEANFKVLGLDYNGKLNEKSGNGQDLSKFKFTSVEALGSSGSLLDQQNAAGGNFKNINISNPGSANGQGEASINNSQLVDSGESSPPGQVGQSDGDANYSRPDNNNYTFSSDGEVRIKHSGPRGRIEVASTEFEHFVVKVAKTAALMPADNYDKIDLLNECTIWPMYFDRIRAFIVLGHSGNANEAREFNDRFLKKFDEASIQIREETHILKPVDTTLNSVDLLSTPVLGEQFTVKIQSGSHEVMIKFMFAQPWEPKLEETSEEGKIRISNEELVEALSPDVELHLYMPRNEKTVLYLKAKEVLSERQRVKLVTADAKVMIKSDDLQKFKDRFITTRTVKMIREHKKREKKSA